MTDLIGKIRKAMVLSGAGKSKEPKLPKATGDIWREITLSDQGVFVSSTNAVATIDRHGKDTTCLRVVMFRENAGDQLRAVKVQTITEDNKNGRGRVFAKTSDLKTAPSPM